MSFQEGGYSSVFGDESSTGSGYEAQSGWEAALEVGSVSISTVNDLLGMLYIPAPLEFLGFPSGDPEPTPPPVVPIVPAVDAGVQASPQLPPVVPGPVGAGTVGAAVETGVIAVDEGATDWGDIANKPAQCDPTDLVCIAEFEGLPEGFGVATDGDPDMAIDWGDVIGVGLGSVAQQLVGGSPTIHPGPPSLQAANPPAKVTVDTRTGQVTPCRRRRRRRLLTPTDLADLASLQTLVGKGSDAMKFAVTKAVRR